MKKFLSAIILTISMLGSQSGMHAAEGATNSSNLITNAAWLFLEQDAQSLAVATATGLGAYFLADLCRQNAEDIDTSLDKDPSIGALEKTSYRTLAFLLKAANITGKAYALTAIASLPMRYVIPILEKNVANFIKSINLHISYHTYYY